MNAELRYGKSIWGIWIICIVHIGCVVSKNGPHSKDELAATALHPYGRFEMHQQELEMVGSAMHFGFSFEGDQCQMVVSLHNSNSHNYLQYELDGVYQKRIRIEGNTTQPITITAPSKGRHTVWVYKATEAHTGPVFIQKITGKKIKPLSRPAAPLIEFIGNSITCGAAADPSEVPCGKGTYHDQHNAYFAYGPRVARALGVQYILSSVSGIGVYRNWNSDGPTMPQVYEHTNFQQNSSRLWDFNSLQPRVASIALGTNDLSGGDGIKKRLPFDSATFVQQYIQFIQLIKFKYPKAQIALLSSPMAGGNRTLLQNCLSAVKQQIDAAYTGDKPVALYFFTPMQARGCTGHPGVEDHALLAAELEPFFKKLLQQ